MMVRAWLAKVGVKALFIEPGSPWENGYAEGLNAKLRDELLNREIFEASLEACVLIERWHRHYNAAKPHSAIGYRPPAPQASVPSEACSALTCRAGLLAEPHREASLEAAAPALARRM